ncbi:MAG TPA: exopolysaccharide transport family protein [Methylovirgula sp.]
MNNPFEPDVSFNEHTSELDMRALGRAIRRKKRWIIWSTLAAFIIIGLYVTLTKPTYTAEAQVLLENQESFLPRPQRNDTPASESASTLDPESVGSQVQLVTSRDIARRAIQQLGLVGNPEFDPLAKGIGPISRVLILFGLKPDPTSVPPEDRVIDTFARRLTVFSPTKTHVLTVQFQSHNADLAARAANKVVSLYIEMQSDAKRQRAKLAAASLLIQIADLRHRLTTSADAVENYRSTSGLLAGANNMTISGQQLADLNGELSKARTAEADVQAKATLIREMIRAGRISDVPDVANNDLVRRIAEQAVAAKAQLALESRTLLPGHPRIKELRAQVADLESQLKTAAANAARTLENNGRIAAARVANLQTAINQQKGSVDRSNADEVHLHELEHVAQALRDQLDASMAKYQEAVARETSPVTPADARMIARAVAPDQPSFPKKGPMLIFGTIAAFVLSTAAVISSELLAGSGPAPGSPIRQPRVLGSSPAEREDREPVLNRLRDFGRSSSQSRANAEKDGSGMAAGTGAAEQAPRILAAATPQERGARIVATATAASRDAAAALLGFARNLACDGRPIILDLNATDSEIIALLQPGEGTLPGSAPGVIGLTDLLTGSASFAEVIHRDSQSRLHYIAFGSAAEFNPPELDLALDALAQTYDFIILAAPAWPANAMALSLAPHADLSILVDVAESPKQRDDADAALLKAGAPEVMVIGPAGRQDGAALNVA